MEDFMKKLAFGVVFLFFMVINSYSQTYMEIILQNHTINVSNTDAIKSHLLFQRITFEPLWYNNYNYAYVSWRNATTDNHEPYGNGIVFKSYVNSYGTSLEIFYWRNGNPGILSVNFTDRDNIWFENGRRFSTSNDNFNNFLNFYYEKLREADLNYDINVF